MQSISVLFFLMYIFGAQNADKERSRRKRDLELGILERDPLISSTSSMDTEGINDDPYLDPPPELEKRMKEVEDLRLIFKLLLGFYLISICITLYFGLQSSECPKSVPKNQTLNSIVRVHTDRLTSYPVAVYRTPEREYVSIESGYHPGDYLRVSVDNHIQTVWTTNGSCWTQPTNARPIHLDDTRFDGKRIETVSVGLQVPHVPQNCLPLNHTCSDCEKMAKEIIDYVSDMSCLFLSGDTMVGELCAAGTDYVCHFGKCENRICRRLGYC